MQFINALSNLNKIYLKLKLLKTKISYFYLELLFK